MPLESKPVTPQLDGTQAARTFTRLQSLEQLPAKGRVEHTGYIQSVSYSAPDAAPLLTAVVVDRLGSGAPRRGTAPHVRLRFMGQKNVPGIKPGVKVRYAGMVAPVDQIPTIYNPRYVIVPVPRG
ncbi:hypothetical protein [Glutamicibacter protophormiae]|uniref:Uncharacterized protein n=1 Tax=Glutamicibacter protophormiae TaxID=37930 RepID=A0ABS4XUQ0_GLUPR|nr:hypothetical protein [Glutamicibacter protophormiae]MBP2400055.1 hypothetical protein [Glutamicibacter protophormiae]GGL75586.1 hypothetical protein GCM10010038_02070 [Glutamicibacter protophormiae]